MTDSSLQDIVCCMGQPVAGNPTQFMLERAFTAAGLDWRCLTLEVAPESLADALLGVRAMDFRGASLTLPHKTAAPALLDALSEKAERIGAVNCVRREEERLIGENTEGEALVQSLKEAIDPAEKKIVLLGAGAAARAIAVELQACNVREIVVVNRTPERGQELVDLLLQKADAVARCAPRGDQYAIDEDADVVIHAAAVGSEDSDRRIPVAPESLRDSMAVADMAVDPRTPLLREAAARGCKTVDGVGVFVRQTAMHFTTWTGRPAEAAVMREAIEEFLEI